MSTGASLFLLRAGARAPFSSRESTRESTVANESQQTSGEASPLLEKRIDVQYPTQKENDGKMPSADDQHHGKQPHADHHGEFRDLPMALFSCFAYMATSISLVLFNKAILSTAHFKAVGVLLLAQQLFTVAVVKVLGAGKAVELPNLSWARQGQLMGMSLWSFLRIFLGLSALKYLNVPMNSAIVRLGCVPTIVAEYLMFRKIPTVAVVISAFVMGFGAFMAAWGDLYFSLPGLLLALGGISSGGWYGVVSKSAFQRQAGAFESDNEWSLLLYQSFGMSVYLMVWVAVMNEMALVVNYPNLWTPSFIIIFVLSSVLASALNYCHFLATNHTSALSVAVCANFKNNICDVLGILIFPDVALTLTFVTGILVSTFGAVMYTAAKFNAVKSSQPQPPSARGGAGKDGKDDAPSSVSSTTSGLTDTSPLSHRPTAVGECVEANGRGEEDT